MKKLLAIDPGAAGGLAWHDGEVLKTMAMPDTDGDLLDMLRTIKAEGIFECHMEDVCGFVQGAGAGQMFAFGQSVGLIKGCLMALGFSLHLHRPQKWQKALSLGTKKDHGKAWKAHLKNRAQQLYPHAAITLKTADALLIYHYASKLP